jgi:hypothetical protein
MSNLRIWFAAFAVSMALALAGSQSAWAEDMVVRFEGTSTGNAKGHAVAILLASQPGKSGGTAKIFVPNQDLKAMKPTPRTELDGVIKKLTVGQIIKISVDDTKEYGLALTSIMPYDAKPGEDTPNGYVFSKSFPGKKDGTLGAIILTKFGVEYSFGVAMRKDEKGAQVQDPDVIAAINGLKEDSGVWVQLAGKNIVAIEPYTAPLTGKVGKLLEADVDGHKVKSAEIETDGGKTVTIYVPGKEVGKSFVPDSLVLAQLNKVKAGSSVEFRVHEDGDKMWLREITAVKAAKPAAK